MAKKTESMQDLANRANKKAFPLHSMQCIKNNPEHLQQLQSTANSVHPLNLNNEQLVINPNENTFNSTKLGITENPSALKIRKAQEEVKRKESKIRNVIKKDVARTFQTQKYFKNEETKMILENVLYNFSIKSEFDYVQGMNFIAAAILHHCLNYEITYNIFLFIQGTFYFVVC